MDVTTCCSRLDCAEGSDEVCLRPAISTELTGQCHTCEVLMEEECVPPCYWDGNCTTDPFAMALKTDLLPPFFFLSSAGGSKAMVQLAVFPPSGKDVDFSGWKGKAKWSSQIAVFALALNQAKNDVINLWNIATDAELGWWAMTIGFMLIFATSSNVPSAMAAQMQVSIFCNEVIGAMNGVEVLDKKRGTIFRIYTKFLQHCYIVPLICIGGLIAIPATVLYPWVAAPVVVIIACGAAALVHLTRGILNCKQKHCKPDEPLLREEDEDSDMHPKIRSEMQAAGLYPGINNRLRDDLFFSGSRTGGLFTYFFWCISYPLLQILITTTVRLLDGYGYFPSIYSTMTERHMTAYMGVVEHGLQSKITLLNIFI